MTAQPPGNGPFASREQAEAVFAGFRQAAERGTSGPPGQLLVFTARQWLADALADTLECFGEVGQYDRQLIDRLAELLDAVDIGVVMSWIYRTARDEYDQAVHVVPGRRPRHLRAAPPPPDP